MLGRLAEIYLEEGGRLGKLACQLSEETGMSYRWVMKYLPDKYKLRPGLGRPSRVLNIDECQVDIDKGQVASRATIYLEKLFLISKDKPVILKGYTNTNFVNLMLEKAFYNRLARLADRLCVAPELIINNAMVMMLEEIEKLVNLHTGVSIKKTVP